MKLLLIIGGAVAAVGLFLLATASADTTLSRAALSAAARAQRRARRAARGAGRLPARRCCARRYRARVFGARLTLRLLRALRRARGGAGPASSTRCRCSSSRARSSPGSTSRWTPRSRAASTSASRRSTRCSPSCRAKANAMALELAERPPAQLATQLERLRAQAGVEEAVLVTASGRLLASASAGRHPLVPELPSAAGAAPGARQPRLYRGRRRRRTPARAARAGAGRTLGSRTRRASCSCARPCRRRSRAAPRRSRRPTATTASSRISREGLKRIYIVTLTFALLMALFVAVAVAVTQSDLLAEPLANLAQATQAVARGDFSRRAPVTSRDELGVLTESFNSMTRQLEEARRGVESNRLALEAAKAHLESILANLSAGVLVFDHELRAVDLQPRRARHPRHASSRRFAARDARSSSPSTASEDWQLELQLKGTGKTLHARGARLPQATGGGYVVVFDDITQPDPGAARHRLGRGGAPPGARDQEPAHADPALGRAAGDEARRAPAARGRRDAAALDPDHRQPGRGAEGDGGRFPRLRAPAGAGAGAARPERAGARGAGAVRELERADRARSSPRRCRRSGPTARRCAR